MPDLSGLTPTCLFAESCWVAQGWLLYIASPCQASQAPSCCSRSWNTGAICPAESGPMLTSRFPPQLTVVTSSCTDQSTMLCQPLHVNQNRLANQPKPTSNPPSSSAVRISSSCMLRLKPQLRLVA